jgi:hypothetical protein
VDAACCMVGSIDGEALALQVGAMCEDIIVGSIVRGAALPADVDEAETSCYTTAIGLTYNDISVGIPKW